MVGALLANGVRTFSNVHAAKLPVTAIAPLKGSCRGVPVLIEDKHILNILLHFEFLSTLFRISDNSMREPGSPI